MLVHDGGSTVSVADSGARFEVAAEPRIGHYDPDDCGWRDRVATVNTGLDSQVGTLRYACPVEGAVGTTAIRVGHGEACLSLRSGWAGTAWRRAVDIDHALGVAPSVLPTVTHSRDGVEWTPHEDVSE